MFFVKVKFYLILLCFRNLLMKDIYEIYGNWVFMNLNDYVKCWN